MNNRLRCFTYDVETKPTKVDIESETKRTQTEDDKISVSARVTVSDNIDIKATSESHADGKIKPYGLSTEFALDVEVKEKVADDVVQEHIDDQIKKSTPKKAKKK